MKKMKSINDVEHAGPKRVELAKLESQVVTRDNQTVPSLARMSTWGSRESRQVFSMMTILSCHMDLLISQRDSDILIPTPEVVGVVANGVLRA